MNIWYSFDNNTKTDVISNKTYYEEKVHMKSKNDEDESSEIIIRSLKNPSCTDVSSSGNIIKYTIAKELGIEIVGDQKIRIPISNSEDDYDILIDEDEVKSEIDKEVNENYLEEKND